MARLILAAALLLAALVADAAAQGTKTPTPATCKLGSQYIAPGGCLNCVSRSSPFTKTFGGSKCYNPTTLTARSTVCTPLVLPAFVRSETNKHRTESCIDPSLRRVSILLVTQNSQAPFLKSSSYIRTSLRLANEIPARKLANGQVLFIQDDVNSRQLVQFDDKLGALRKRRGKTIQLTGVLARGADLLPWCFVAYLKVC